ncbi:MAG: nucleotidyltransferase domain-containing protein [Desulfurococcales archaeon]|nr:nucleotidyltransferase domain-containing protein [Desulfurococcales archaeon]
MSKREVKVEKIILFGSVARGDFTESSDIDLLVVSKDWEGMTLEERLSILYRLWDKPRDATLIPLTPEELRRKAKTSVIIGEAIGQGIVVYEPRST